MKPQVPRLLRAIKRPATLRPRLVDQTPTHIIKVRAPPINKRQLRPVIEQHAPMTGTAGPPTFRAGQLYHKRRDDSATLVVWG